MSQTFVIVISAVLAAVLLFQLYNVLGKKVGRQPEDQAKKALKDGKKTLPTLAVPRNANGADPKAAPVPAIDPVLEAAISGLKARDPQFDPARFVEGARQAYETIVRAYARGDREALRPLLSERVMTSFEAGIVQREAAGQSEVLELVSPARADIEEATVNGDVAIARVRFLAEVRSTVTNAEGETTTQERRTAEIWTFERRLGAQDPNWSLARVAAATA